MGRVDGKVALVTGACRGNGEGIARVLAREGATVAMTDVEERVHETSRRMALEGCRTISYNMNVTDPAEIHGVVRTVLDRYGKIDILVNNAGIAKAVPFVDMTDELRDEIFNVNFNGVWNCCSAVLPHMIEREHGRVINISSVTGPFVVFFGETAYAASKGAVSAFTKALALEVAKKGITVNAICPGYFDTPMVRNVASEVSPDDPQSVIDRRAKCVPMGRFGTIDELGELACYLACDESSYMTGALLVIDGGSILPEAGSSLG